MATLGFTDWLSMIGTFSVVLVLLVLTLVMLKKMGPNLGNANGKRIKVLEAHNLGARQRLLLISVNQKQILMAMSPSGITKLDHFDSTDIFENSHNDELKTDVSSGSRKSFRDIISQVIKK